MFNRGARGCASGNWHSRKSQHFINFHRANWAQILRETPSSPCRMTAMKNSRLIWAVLLWGFAAPLSAESSLCTHAAALVARESRVPYDVLMGISLTETGRQRNGRMQPWPWAANGQGRGHWFATRAEAEEYAQQMLASGHRSFDLGCFQINWRWHGDQFDRPAELLDPLRAARYAARLLTRFHRELGSWDRAAGAYHSRTPRHANRYRARFRSMRAQVGAPPRAPQLARLQSVMGRGSSRPVSTAQPRENSFALLTGTPSGASLVPVNLPMARPLPLRTATPFNTGGIRP